MDTQLYISIFVISGCTFGLFFSIVLFIRRKFDQRNLAGSILFLLQPIWMYCNYYRIFKNTNISNIYIFGIIIFLLDIPVIYIFLRSLIDIYFRPNRKFSVLFVISLFLIVPLALTLLLPGNEYIWDEGVGISIIITVVSFGHLYVVILLTHIICTAVIRLSRDKAWTVAYIMFIVFILLLDLSFGFYFINLIFKLGCIRYSFLFGTLLIYYFFIIYFSFPVFSSGTFRSGPSQSDILRDIDIALVIGRLKKLMKVDRVYREESLTQRRLAEMAGLSPQQLSAVLALHMDTGYYLFINSFRVAEAKDLLTSSQDMKVIDVAYAVGFKSLSVFYKAFNDETGISPKAFQQNLQ